MLPEAGGHLSRLKGAQRVFVQILAPSLEMGGEQRQVETLANLLLPGPNKDAVSDPSTVWGLTGQVGGSTEAS